MTDWSGTAKSSGAQAEVDFVFSDATDFTFSDGSDFVFVEQRDDINWSAISKSV